MKTALCVLLVLVASFAVNDAQDYCLRCKAYCTIKSCGYYMCVNKDSNYYCCCFSCAADTYFSIGRVRSAPVHEMREIPSVDNL